MRQLLWLFRFILSFLLVCSSSLSSFSSTHHLCPRDQRLALLQFKHMFPINGYDSFQMFNDCFSSYPKMVSWNESETDCCLWDGVTCDRLTGHVIELDLSCSQLLGTIPLNNSLFQLSQLKRLNLAYNEFYSSYISSAFGHFTDLTHLNLSFSGFSGSIPPEICHLSKLVSLDLSSSSPLLKIEPHIFNMLFKNLTELQEVLLLQVNISSILPDSLMNLSSLMTLDLSFTGLQGNLPNNIFHLPNLQSLFSFNNYELNGNLPKINSSCSSLKELGLADTSLFGELPYSIGNLKSLNYLDLSRSGFSGSIPRSLGNLTQLSLIDFSGNSFNGKVPSTLSKLIQLNRLSLSNNNLEGEIPDVFGELIKLEFLELGYNKFNGRFPCEVANLAQLVYLDISSNAITGPIPSIINGLQNLQWLYLYNNSLNGTIPSWLFTLPSLVWLDLSSNRLTGQIHEFHHRSSLEYINFHYNELCGPIPQSMSNLVNLTELYLSSNNFSGVVDLHIFSNLKNLVCIDLSYNGLSVSTNSNINNTLPTITSFRMSSCKIEKFPNFLRSLQNLQMLDLSNNKIHGQIPKWVGDIGRVSLSYLNLSHNFLTGIKQLPWKNLETLDLHSNLLQGPLPVSLAIAHNILISHNKFSGEIPLSVCDSGFLRILDLSYNNLSGVIPQCLGDLYTSLSVLDLRSNSLHGTILLTFAKGNELRNLNLNDNQFEGPVPQSLTNCRHLEVLDLGNNKINDSFPYWLGTLPMLQVVVLRSNRFRGAIGTSKPNLFFPKLRILDLSHNKFTGRLPWRYFKNFKAMKNKAMPNKKYMGTEYYRDSVTVTMKGFEIQLTSIFTIFTTIDLSSNKFSGHIPNVIRSLTSLVLLNLSHNSLTGYIPASLGELLELESLDLSSNQLIGKIPTQLTSLTFLEVLNLSWNHLDGPIPRGKQFETFENDSYVGNLQLCGFPLSKECEYNQARHVQPMLQQQEDDSDFSSGFTWKVVLMGYGCGMALGFVIGYCTFFNGRPNLFVTLLKKKTKRR